MEQYILGAERKNCQPRILYLAKLSFVSEGLDEDFPRQTKLKDFTARPAFQETLEILQAEMKRCILLM